MRLPKSGQEVEIVLVDGDRGDGVGAQVFKGTMVASDRDWVVIDQAYDNSQRMGRSWSHRMWINRDRIAQVILDTTDART